MQKLIYHLYMIPLFISVLLSLKSFRLQWPAPYKLFSGLLAYIFFAETLTISWKYLLPGIAGWPYSQDNLWLYNILIPPQYLLYMAVYYKVIRSAMVKRMIVAAGILYLLFAISNMLFLQTIYKVNSLTWLVSGIIVILLTVAYFEQVLKQREIIRLSKHPLVWITLGAFIFHVADFPFVLSLNSLLNIDSATAVTLFYLHLILNCLMYSLYSIAFLCHPPPPK